MIGTLGVPLTYRSQYNNGHTADFDGMIGCMSVVVCLLFVSVVR